MKEPDYQQAFYDVLRAVEILTGALTSGEHSADPRIVPNHLHAAIADSPTERALDHLRSARRSACLDGFGFDYLDEDTIDPESEPEEQSPTDRKATE